MASPQLALLRAVDAAGAPCLSSVHWALELPGVFVQHRAHWDAGIRKAHAFPVSAVREHLPLSELQVGKGSRTGGMQLWLSLA